METGHRAGGREYPWEIFFNDWSPARLRVATRARRGGAVRRPESVASRSRGSAEDVADLVAAGESNRRGEVREREPALALVRVR